MSSMIQSTPFYPGYFMQQPDIHSILTSELSQKHLNHKSSIRRGSDSSCDNEHEGISSGYSTESDLPSYERYNHSPITMVSQQQHNQQLFYPPMYDIQSALNGQICSNSSATITSTQQGPYESRNAFFAKQRKQQKLLQQMEVAKRGSQIECEVTNPTSYLSPLNIAEGDSKFKTEMCKNWSEYGKCNYGKKCQFAHGRHELKLIKPANIKLYKSKQCNSFHTLAACPYGYRCMFIHESRNVSQIKSDFHFQRRLSEFEDTIDTTPRLRFFEKLTQDSSSDEEGIFTEDDEDGGDASPSGNYFF